METATGKRIYIVDDEALIGEMVLSILELEGYEPRFFVNPEEAFEAIRDEELKPDLLITDFLMQPINGMELIEKCRSVMPDLKTILYSGNVREEITRYFVVKPDCFLPKPFLPKNLIELVEATLKL